VKAFKIKALAVLVATLAGSMSTVTFAQTTLYTDSFGGAGTALNGTLVQGGTLQTGAVAWSANSAFLNNGTMDGNVEGSAILPFVPVVNSTYTLSLDVFNTTDRWVGLGFKNSALTAPGTDQVNDRLSNGGGIAWMLYRDHLTDPLQDIQLFAGLNTGNPIADNDSAVTFNQFNNLKIILNTTGDGSTFTADFQVNNASISSGPQVVNQPISAIQYVAMSYDDATAAAISYDNFLFTQTITGPTINEWNVNGGGTFGAAANWTMGAPAAGSTVLFGGALTALNSPATVTLTAPATLGEVQFSNAGASYNLAGPSILTLNGVARVATIAGNHEISAAIAGSAGLTKTGGGQLTLSAINSYTGTTNVQAGSLRVLHPAAVNGAVNVDAGASFFFEGNGQGTGFIGPFSPNIAGAGEVGLSAELTSEIITFDNPKSYTGITTINGGTLRLMIGGTLGTSDGTATTRTQIGGNESTGRLAISGGKAVANELLVLGARELSAIDAVHLTSSGSNSWSGNIKGEVGGSQYNIESTSGTLTLSGLISAPDTAPRNFVFNGAGNINVTGKIIDLSTDANGTPLAGPVNAANNVSVTKRGAGKLTISTATAVADDYWRGATSVETGTLEVLSDGSNNGELRSSTIAVRAGAILDIDSFSNYSVQSAQDVSGGGDIHAQTISIFGDSLVSPGDNGVGTLTLHGAGGTGNANVYLGSDFFDAPGARGGLAYDLRGATTVGGGVNDLLTGVNNLTLDVEQYSDALSPLNTDAPIEVLITPVQNQLASGGAGTYRLVNYTGTLTQVSNTAVTFAPQLQGVGVTRQTLSVSTATAGQVNLVVSGAAENLTWNGTAGNNSWDVDVSTNWTGADSRFKDLDSVTFGAGGVKDVVLNSNVNPNTVNFSGGAATTYTVTGTGGIRGGATVNVNSGTVRLQNRANAYTGTTTIANGARLEMGTASSGGMVVNGTLAVPSTLTIATIDTFDDTNLSDYTFTKILDNGTVTNVSFASPSGVLAASYAGAEAQAEQVLFFRNDGINLEVGEEVRVDNELVTANAGGQPGDFGIAVGANPSAGVRDNYLFMSYRGATQLNTRGFNNGTELAQVQSFGVNADQLFIARTASDTYEVGWYDGGTRNILTTRTGVNASVGNNVGFYSDLRIAGATYDGLDNLVITTGTAFNTISVAGNLNLAATGTLELDVSAFDFTSLDVSGSATLAGTLSVNLLDGFMPEEGTSYAFLTAAGGITNSGLSFDLPALAGGLIWDTSDFFTSGVLNVVTAGLAGDFDNDGDVDGRDFLLWQRNPGVGNLSDWQANYGQSGPLTASSAAVPEPGTVALVCGTLFVLAGLRRRSSL
jgi:autotransporter-associated beta strand protein